MIYDLVVIGAGPAGMAAALSAKRNGLKNILLVERDDKLGGILNQCIHSGFGLHTFNEELTGPEYAQRNVKEIYEAKIDYLLNSMVIEVSGADENGICRTYVVSKEKGFICLESQSIILAMGCREKSRGALNIPGYRPAGVYSAGTAQRYVNIEGKMPGKEVVILGSGDIGLIMARRMVLEGATVKCVAEIAPYSGGLRRNIVQCLDDYDIPLLFSHTVTKIHGKKRVEGVTISKVDDNYNPIPGTEQYIECDTLLLSCGLIPENELTVKAGAQMDSVTQGPIVNDKLLTTVDGIFACGNVLHVHDLADNVTKESVKCGENAAKYVLNPKTEWGSAQRPDIPKKEKNTIPEGMDRSHQMICICCPNGCLLNVENNADGSYTVSGNLCPRGEEYAINEMTNPVRSISSTIKVKGGKEPLVSCKTDGTIPKDMISKVMVEIGKTSVEAPIEVNDVLIENVCATGVNIVATNVNFREDV